MLEFLLAALALAAGETTGGAGAGQRASGESTPQSVAGQPAPAAQQAPPEKPKKICRKISGTGSRLDTGRVCKTAEEWKRFYNE